MTNRWRFAALVMGACSLTACSGGGTTSSPASRTPSASYPAGEANTAPQTFTTGPVTCADGEIFVAASTLGITVHDLTAAGDVRPRRTIGGAATGLVPAGDADAPGGVAVDVANEELFASAGNGILVFAAGASGNVAPLRSIAGSSTGLNRARKLALDPVNGELWVAQQDRLAAFARDASGDVAPLRVIDTGGAFQLMDVAVDPANGEVVAAATSPTVNGIKVYARTASGTAPPLRQISGGSTGLSFPTAVAVDAANGEIVAINSFYLGNSAVSTFSRTASGNVAPLRKIQGPATGLANPYAVLLAPGRDEVLVGNHSAGITAYARTASGNVPPARTLAGANTALGAPWHLALREATSYCAQGSACAAGGCLPSGAVDCANGYYCASGEICDWMVGIPTCVGGEITPGAALCAFGTSCPSGSTCASGGCMPVGDVDCLLGVHCPRGSTCISGGRCVLGGVNDCGNGKYCEAGFLCDPTGVYCIPKDAVDCGDGYYCLPGMVCSPAGGAFVCDAPPTGGGGAHCYSTSACIPGALSNTCSCAGATTPGECVSGYPACSAVGGPCGDGQHSCCVGETCIYNQCVSGCGECAGKGCQP